MAGTAVAAEYQALADAFSESARANKRAERAHRDAARQNRIALDALLAFCRVAGIEIVVIAEGGTDRGSTVP